MAASEHALGERVEPHLTYEDYSALPDDGRRHEIVEGELYVTPAPSTPHQRVSLNLASALREHVRQLRLGAVFTAPCDVILAEDTIVQPDVLYVARERRSIVTDRAIEGAPDLVVEILSPGTRRVDRTTKMRVYVRVGVRECWIVDPDAQTVEVFALAGGAYVLAQAASGAARVASALFPGLELDLATIFAPAFE